MCTYSSVHRRGNFFKRTHCMQFNWICYIVRLGDIRLRVHIFIVLTFNLFCRPESLGIVVGIVYLVIAILFQHFNFAADSMVCLWLEVIVPGIREICVMPETCVCWCSQWLVEYNAALASVCFMILLGFIDDVLDIPWRVYVLSQSVIQFIPTVSLSCLW